MTHYVFKLPDVGEGMAEAEVIAWHVAVGDKVLEDQNLVDVMTDKATVEITSPISGVVVSLNGQPGEMVAIGAPLVEFELDSVEPTIAAPQRSEPAPTPSATPVTTRETRVTAGERALASPAIRKRAQDMGVDLQSVTGTGPDGRISHADLDRYLASSRNHTADRPQQAPRNDIEEVKLIGLRRRIADKMQESKRRIPHFSYVEEIDMTELE
ncbi:MAG: E3 binding domain-containing protein, partial [Alphaproteobacteria bacterium]|nr:E3 binding domain-containing protein [Alphaproteobacteria bacterium]